MLTSEKALKKAANERGYRPEILEKVYRLLELIEDFMSVPYLRERLALKGGTAINLFCSENLPRLSIDLDFNYIGALDRELMKKEKLELESTIFEYLSASPLSIASPSSCACGRQNGTCLSKYFRQ